MSAEPMDARTQLVVRTLREESAHARDGAEIATEDDDAQAAAELAEEAHALEQIADALESGRLRLVEAEHIQPPEDSRWALPEVES